MESKNSIQESTQKPSIYILMKVIAILLSSFQYFENVQTYKKLKEHYNKYTQYIYAD